MYLELALAAQATAIVSGDRDLLVLHPWHGILILPPAVYLVG
jgi:predicted nucleic acid-binding protein